MKKILYTILALAGLAAVSCTKDEPKVVFDPDNVTAPTLGTVTGATLSADGEALTFDYTEADFGYLCATGYSLYAALDEGFAEQQKVSAGFADGKITVAHKDLNTAIINLGGEVEKENTVYLKVNACMLDDKNQEIGRTNVSSNIQSAVFVSYNMLISEADVYPHVWIVGNYNGQNSVWDFALCQHLYNYSGDSKTYEGVIDFGEPQTGVTNEFKVNGVGNWDDSSKDWGVSKDVTPDSEASSITLLSGGGTNNITCYARRFYHFSFDSGTGVLKNDWSADQIGVIGANGDWNNDIVMDYNPTYVRFYADVEIASQSEVKFRADATWGPNEWGLGASDGIVALKGGNIAVAAGSYRVYLDLNKMTYELNASMYGQPEPGMDETPEPGPEPEPAEPTAWSVIGTINGTNWNTDVDMTNTEGKVWVVENLALTASDEFKLRADHGWDIQASGPEANAVSTIDPSNPYDVFKATVGETFKAGDNNGKNIVVGIEGTYDITYDYEAGTILIENHE